MNTQTTVARVDSVQELNTESLFGSWIRYLQVSPKSAEVYTRNLKQFFAYVAYRKIEYPTRGDVLRYLEDLEHGIKDEKGNYVLKEDGKTPVMKEHKDTSIQAYLNAVKLFFSWADSEGLYPDIARHIKPIKVSKAFRKDYLTSNEMADVLDVVDTATLTGKRDFAIILLMSTTGIRTMSVVSADIRDLRTKNDSTVLYYQCKGHREKDTFVRVPEEVVRLIRDYLKARGETDGKAPLFASVSNRNQNGRMTTRSVSRLVKDALIDANLGDERHTAHSLRHTAATLNLLNGGSTRETQQLLNHASVDTTERYSHDLEAVNNMSSQRVYNAILEAYNNRA